MTDADQIYPCTAGGLRAALAGLPDEAPVFPRWRNGPPADHEPGVEVFGFRRQPPGLAILVGLFYLNDEEPEDGDDDAD